MSRPTAVQLMFEAICDVFEWDPATLPKSARTRIGKVGRELREVGATPEMVRFSREVLDRRFGDKVYGPEAIALWWGEVVKRWSSRARARERRLDGQSELYERPTPEELAEARRRWRQMTEELGLGTTSEVVKNVE